MRVTQRISLILILAILLPLIVTSLPAQKVSKDEMIPPPEKARLFTEKMKTVLKLNDDQFAKAMKLNLDYFTASDAIQRAMLAEGKDPGDLKKEMKKSKAEQMKQIKLLLTGEQWVLFKENRKEFDTMFRPK